MSGLSRINVASSERGIALCVAKLIDPDGNTSRRSGDIEIDGIAGLLCEGPRSPLLPDIKTPRVSKRGHASKRVTIVTGHELIVHNPIVAIPPIHSVEIKIPSLGLRLYTGPLGSYMPSPRYPLSFPVRTPRPVLTPAPLSTPRHNAEMTVYAPPIDIPDLGDPSTKAQGCLYFSDTEVVMRNYAIGKGLILHIRAATIPRGPPPDVIIDMRVAGVVTMDEWYRQLNLYEMKQLYLESEFERGSTKAVAQLTELEAWFVGIVEPAPHRSHRYYVAELAEWAEREQTRVETKKSPYCNERVTHLIHPV